MTQTGTPAANSKIIDVDLERALEIIEQMPSKEKDVTPSMTIVRGVHPDYGDIYVIIPPIGNPTLLPVVVHSSLL